MTPITTIAHIAHLCTTAEFTGSDATADAVLVLEPSGDSHITYLYMNPRSTRDTDAFYRDAKYGELWVGRRFTL
jgi:Xaa-Pro aminopeptidase